MACVAVIICHVLKKKNAGLVGLIDAAKASDICLFWSDKIITNYPEAVMKIALCMILSCFMNGKKLQIMWFCQSG
jgi:hypothetical protein